MSSRAEQKIQEVDAAHVVCFPVLRANRAILVVYKATWAFCLKENRKLGEFDAWLLACVPSLVALTRLRQLDFTACGYVVCCQYVIPLLPSTSHSSHLKLVSQATHVSRLSFSLSGGNHVSTLLHLTRYFFCETMQKLTFKWALLRVDPFVI